MPSRLELPVVPGVTTTTALPPCPGLRGEPCRDYEPSHNAAASLMDAGDTSDTSHTSGTTTEPSASNTAGPSAKNCAAISMKHKTKHDCRKKKRKRKKQ